MVPTAIDQNSSMSKNDSAVPEGGNFSQASMSPKGLDIKFGLNYLNIVKNTKNELSIKSSANSQLPVDSEGNRVIDDFSSEEENEDDQNGHSTFKSLGYYSKKGSTHNERLLTVNEERSEDGKTKTKKKDKEVLSD